MVEQLRDLDKAIEAAFVEEGEGDPQNDENNLENFVEAESAVFSGSVTNAAVAPVEHSHGQRYEN